MRRSSWFSVLAVIGLGASALAAVNCGGGGGGASAQAQQALPEAPLSAPRGQANAVSVSIDVSAAGEPVNRAALGGNVQWVDLGDDMITSDGQLRADMLDAARQLAPTTLRYPGGALADAYHWQQGMGPIGSRGLNKHVHSHTSQPTLMGTQEFLELCEALGAEPVFTVNVASGTVDEAVAWLRKVNVEGLTSTRTGQRLPRVRYWELGNEPYLKMDGESELWISPADYAQRVRQFAQALRQADPSIQMGLALSQDTRHGIPITAYPNVRYMDVVLAGALPDVNFVSLHNAYVPFGVDRAYSPDLLYWGGMAGARTVQADLAAVRVRLDALAPSKQWPLAITEYNALFTLNKGDSDTFINSPTGALVLADLLRVLSSSKDVLMAQHWSLSGNWVFGALRKDASLRPGGLVLALYNEALQGQRLPASVQAPTVDVPRVGASEAVKALPMLEAVATRQGQTLRVVLIHKDPANPARLSLNLEGGVARTLRLSTLSGNSVWDTSDRASAMQRQNRVLADAAAIDLPAASVSLLTIDFAPRP